MSAEISLPPSDNSPTETPGEGQQRVTKNAGIYFVSQLLSWIATFCVVSIVPRTLGENIIGQVAYLSNAVGIVTTLFSMGIDSFLVAEIRRDPKQTERLLRATFGLRLLIVVPSNLVAWAVLFALHASPLILYISIFASLADCRRKTFRPQIRLFLSGLKMKLFVFSPC